MTITLRPVLPSDRDFLFRVFASTRPEVEQLPWDPQQRRSFVEMQFNAQTADYESRFPDSEHSVILVNDEPRGRIWIDRRPDEIRLLDIALLSEHRDQGAGRVLLERLIAEAGNALVPLRHSVYKENVGALRFYDRLGFEVIEDFGQYVLMEWVGD